MKLFQFLAFPCLAAALLAQAPAEPTQIRSVYLLPMVNGFDQYLANQLTKLGPYYVVTDPLRADAVFTERLGEAFEVRFNELFPVPEPVAVKPEKKKDDKNSDTEEPAKQEVKDQGRGVPPSSFGRGKGTL